MIISYFTQLDFKKYIYKNIFYISAISLLLKDNQHCSSESKNNLHCNFYKIFNMIVTLATTLIVIFSFTSYFYYGKLYSSKQIIGALCLHLVYTLFRIQLYICLNDLHSFKRKISLIPCSARKLSYIPFGVIIWCALIISLMIFFFASFFNIMFTSNILKLFM